MTAENTVTMDLTDAGTTTAAVAALDDAQRALLLRALTDAEDAANHTALLENIRTTLSGIVDENGPEAVGVAFRTAEWDNGHFLTERGTVVFSDGTTTDADFDVDDLFSAMFGTCGEKTTLYVDLGTGDADVDDYPYDHPQTRFGAPVPQA